MTNMRFTWVGQKFLLINRVSKIISFIVVALISLNLSGKEINIGLFYSENIQEAGFSAKNSFFDVFCGHDSLTRILPNGQLSVKIEKDKLRLLKNGRSLGRYDSLYLKSADSNSIIHIKTKPNKTKSFKGDFKILPCKGQLKIINHINLDDYVEGVIAAEAGISGNLEFYKVQAILARTYALHNKQKHSKEGFSLCNTTHCQVYKGLTNDDKIKKAVEATKGLVIVDTSGQIITSTYHSNSGGQTMNGKDVWGKEFPYLVSVVDSFSLAWKNGLRWEKTIDTSEWFGYLREKLNDSIMYSYINLQTLDFKQEQRKVYFDTTALLPLTELRGDWGLKSTFFSIQQEGAKVVLYGRGYGHGVGLSQTGAMKMADMGFYYDEIIHFYYHNVEIVPLEEVGKVLMR